MGRTWEEVIDFFSQWIIMILLYSILFVCWCSYDHKCDWPWPRNTHFHNTQYVYSTKSQRDTEKVRRKDGAANCSIYPIIDQRCNEWCRVPFTFTVFHQLFILFFYFTGPECYCCFHHKSVIVGFVVLLLQSSIGRQHILESGMDARRPPVPFISIITLWIIGCIVIHRIGHYYKPICNDRPSTHLSQVLHIKHYKVNAWIGLSQAVLTYVHLKLELIRANRCSAKAAAEYELC